MSGLNVANFMPYETVPLDATTSSSSVAFKLPSSWTDMSDVMVSNEGSVTAFVGFYSTQAVTEGKATLGTSAQLPGTTGTLQCCPVLGGETMVLNKNAMAGNFGTDTCVGITRTGSAQLYFTSGRGS